MATASRSTRGSLSLGSQEYFEYFCQPCSSKDGANLEAEGYCTDCAEFLCAECYRIHRRPTALQHHVLVEGEAMKQHGPPPPDHRDTPSDHRDTASDHRVTPSDHRDTSADQCDQHRGKVSEYFCTVHEELACTACLMMKHRTCDPVLFIPDEASHITESPEYKGLIQTLTVMETNAADVKASFQVQSWTADDVCAKAIQEYDNFRDDVIGVLDDFKQELVKTAESIRDADKERAKSKLESTERTAEKIQKFHTDLQNLETNKKFTSLFIATKQSGEKIQSLKTELKGVQPDGNITQYTFVPNDQTKQLLGTKEGVGSIQQVLGTKEPRQSSESTRTRTPTLFRKRVDKNSTIRPDTHNDTTPLGQLKKPKPKPLVGSMEDVRSIKQEMTAAQCSEPIRTHGATATTPDQPSKKKKPGFGAVSQWNSRRKAKKQQD